MNPNKNTNILIVGVGGQGIVLASEVLASVGMASHLDVKQSEVHGMAQRGGSVSSHVRFGEKVYSPVIEKGTADILLSFELLEALRWADHLKLDGIMIVNNRRINPLPVASGKEIYPEYIHDQLKQKCGTFVSVDGQALALKAGQIKTENVVLLGVLSNFLNITDEAWLKAIQHRVPLKAVDANIRAFRLGREWMPGD